MTSRQLVFIDTEFTCLSDPRLLSFGAITEDGQHELYFELDDVDVNKYAHPFTKANVIPLMDNATFGDSRYNSSKKLRKWLETLGGSVAICPDYIADWELMSDLLQNRIPMNVETAPAMYHKHLISTINSLLNARGVPLEHYPFALSQAKHYLKSKQSELFEGSEFTAHHALHDAKVNRLAYLHTIKQMHTILDNGEYQ